MREVAERRQQLELEHEQARLSLQEKQEEVRRLQQVGSGARDVGWLSPSHATCSSNKLFFIYPLPCAKHWSDQLEASVGGVV